MVAWFFCACCSGARDKRQQYRYEVVYRREESLYSGQDYLESLPGGARSSLPNQRTPSLRRENAATAGLLPITQGHYPPILSTPTGADSLVRQNRVNHFLTTLKEQETHHQGPLIRGRGSQGAHFHPWRSTNYIGQPPVHHLTPFNPRFPGNSNILHSRSAPLLALPSPNVSFGPTPGPHVHSRDQSLSSRDLSLASSANSSRPLLPQGKGRRPPHLRPLQSIPSSSFKPLYAPRSPHTPLSPGPPGYPPVIGDSFLQRYPPPGSLTRDLRQYLSTRFPKGGVDHDLQNTIRDNVYLRTVPVTTRPPRPGEVNGVDYTFLSQEEFQALQRSGNLLEAGIFEGNHYGTPKPPAQGGEVCRGSSSILSGAHPSSEGKRRRNRSNVEAMAANMLDTSLPPNPSEAANLPFRGPVPYQSPQDESHFPTSELGPLPPNWEQAYTENGEAYFIDHVAGTSSWLDPRLARIQKRSAEECQENELPFGWERIDDPQYGTYYIDHVNRKTQYENPVIMAKRPTSEESIPINMDESISSTFPRPKKAAGEMNGSNQKITENGQSYHSKRSHSLLPCILCLPCSHNEKKNTSSPSVPPLIAETPELTTTAPLSFLKTSSLRNLSGGTIESKHRSTFESKFKENLNLSNCKWHSEFGDPVRPINFNLSNSSSCFNASLPSTAMPSDYQFYWDVQGWLHRNQSRPIWDSAFKSNSIQCPSHYRKNSPINQSVGSVRLSSHWRKFSPYSHSPSPFSSSALPSVSFSSLCSPEDDPVVNVTNFPWKGRTGTSSNFTRNPSDLKGEFLRTTLVKSSRGLGFTIVGGDDNEEEFLQIKSVVPNGPAWQDGKLRTGDVLVYVGDTCVLGYTHADVVNMFQNIEPGRTVYLEVCRGYPLPFDPNDPNTEIVTTVAVTSADSRSSKSAFGEEYDSRSRNNSNESMNTAKSMPDLSNTERIQQVPRPGSADLLSSENYEPNAEILEFYPSNITKPDYLTIPIVKGSMGFGFTIADSAYGQKVKKILDRSRCKNLAESDILVDINNINVKGMSHTEVVQVLKECPQGHEAIIMVQRGGLNSPSKSRGGTRKDPASSPKKSSTGPTAGGLYRSKTPTADMYSSQPKEVIPNRPKTPLVDTRNRPKTPTSYNDVENVDIVNTSGEFQSHYNPNHPPYPGAFSYTGTNPKDQGGADHKVNNIASQLSHASLNGNSFDRSSDKYHVYSQDSQDSNNGNYNYHREFYNQKAYQINQPSFEYEKDNFNKNVPNHSEPFAQYSYYNNGQPNGNVNSYNDSMDQYIPDQQNSYGYIPYPKESYDVPRQDSGYSSQAQIPPSRNPYPPYYGQNSSVGYSGPQPEGYVGPPEVHRRKESTSFELEHPAPVPMPKYHTLNSGLSRQGPEGGGTPSLEMSNMPYHEFTVTLPRQEHGFGFRIVGGTEEGSQVSIGHIVPGGSADLDGRVMSGDDIICVDSEVVLGSSHHRVVELMASAANHGRVTVTLRRPLHIPSHSDAHNQSMEIQQFPYDVVVTRRENEGFGFVIISSVAKSGSTIGRILSGSPAERCSKLHVGDRILRVNGIDIKSLHHGSIVNLIKESGYEVTLTIGPPRDDTSSTTSNSQRAESDTGDDGELYHVELSRGNRGFGFSIRGGREFHNMPLFVLRIAENGPAAEDSKLKVGDQLMEINGVSTKDMTHADAIELIKQCGNAVGLIVRRGGRLPLHLDPLSPMSASNLGSPVGPPPPGTHIRSTTSLPAGSPGSSHMNPYPPQNSTQHYGYASQSNMMMSSYSSAYPSNDMSNRAPQPLHSSPATQYPSMPLNPHASNGPLGQSSPRVLGPPDSYYWNRVPDHRPG